VGHRIFLLLLALAADTPAGLFFPSALGVSSSMVDHPIDILLVDNDPDLAEMIEEHLTQALCARVERAASIADAMREELTARHELILASTDLPDGDAAALIEQMRLTNDCPIILMGRDATVAETIEAFRHGAADFFVKPFELSALTDSIRLWIERMGQVKRERSRHQRLRRTASRIIRDRRDLRQRMELICQDIVRAYRDLAEKVSDTLADNQPLPK
jgi:DNA-binding response OmpR family regulator